MFSMLSVLKKHLQILYFNEPILCIPFWDINSHAYPYTHTRLHLHLHLNKLITLLKFDYKCNFHFRPRCKRNAISFQNTIININVDLQIYTFTHWPFQYKASGMNRMINLFWFNRVFSSIILILLNVRCLVLHPFDVMHNHEVMFVYLLIRKYLYGL